MALIDNEAVLLDLEEYVRSRTSHGQRHLLDHIAALKQAHRVDEGLAEKYLRITSNRITEMVHSHQTPPDLAPTETNHHGEMQVSLEPRSGDPSTIGGS